MFKGYLSLGKVHLQGKRQIIPEDSAIIPDASYIALTNDKCEKISDRWYKMVPETNRYLCKAIDIPSTNAPIPLDKIEENIEFHKNIHFHPL